MLSSYSRRQALLSIGAAFAAPAVVRAQSTASVQVPKFRLEEAASFQHQVTGVTAAPDGRVFVNFPRWTEDTPISVAELAKDGSLKPYPDDGWNAWRNAEANKIAPTDRFVCVQSVVADGNGNLWVLDPAAPGAEKVIAGGPKLVRIELATNKVAQV